jgi:hypothetical protein
VSFNITGVQSEHIMTKPSELPPNWKPDLSLKDLIPAEYDWRLFRRVTEASDRYAVRIDGLPPYVWNLIKRCPASLMAPGSKGRRIERDPNPFIGTRKIGQRPKPAKQRKRVRLYLGRLAGEKSFSLARLVCTAVYGPPPHSQSEAHHIQVSDDGYDDAWQNLRWRSPGENRAIEHIRRKPPMQHAGSKNTNARIHYADLVDLIHRHDVKGEKPSSLARRFRLSVSQVRRLINEQSRTDEVRRIRKTYSLNRNAGRTDGLSQHT